MEQNLWAIVGLGNPGRQFSETRHNVGFRFIERISRRWKAKLRKKMFLSKVAIMDKDKVKLLLAMPQTYMNRSGMAVKKIIKEGGVKPEKMVVIYDDLDLPLGEIRIRMRGGAGTHKGMSSILAEIGTTSFPRIRIGIGPLDEGKDSAEFVLNPFRKEELPLLEKGLLRAEEALELLLKGEAEKAMNIYNKKVKSLEEKEERKGLLAPSAQERGF